MKMLRGLMSKHRDVIDILNPDLRFFEFFIINDQISIALVTNIIYTLRACEKFSPLVLNIFLKENQTWFNKLENFEHFENFYGCIVPFTVQLDFISFYFDEMKELSVKTVNISEITLKIRNDDIKYHGLVHEVLQTIAKIANFTTYYQLYDGNFLFNQRHFNFNYSLPVLKILIGNVQGLNKLVFFHSIPFFNQQYFYTVTPNDLYTNYEKIFMPFDQVTWSLLIFTFGLTFGLIFVINIYYKWLQTIVCGEGIKMPAYNALGIFFGVSQTRLPRHYFSRLILLLFIWFCLIIRTCYQSVMFEFMTSDMRKPLPQSIDDLIKWNYTIIVQNESITGKNINRQIIGENFNVKILEANINDYCNLYKDALDGKNSEKFAFFTNDILHTKLSSISKNSLTIMGNEDEKFLLSLMLKMSNNDILFKHLDYVMQNFVSNGIAKHLVDYALWFLARPYDVEVEDPRRILSMKDLEFGFVIWLFACCLAILVFIYEISNFIFRRKFRKIFKKFVGLINFMKVLKARLSDYHDRW